MKITITTGKGSGPTPLAAFDSALCSAGIGDYNLVRLSSVIPPDSVLIGERLAASPEKFGHRLYVVLSIGSAVAPGTEAWAGLGWIQDPSDGKGLFAEIEGRSESEVQAMLRDSLADMLTRRTATFGPVCSEVVGVEYQECPACAVVAAVYPSAASLRSAATKVRRYPRDLV